MTGAGAGPPDGMDRRTLLRAIAAAVAAGALPACGEEPRWAVPSVDDPGPLVPGVPRHYATATTFMGYAQPVMAQTREGRPIKLEGNPRHPAVRGASDAFTQAALLSLYDPARSRGHRHAGRATTPAAFEAAMVENAARLAARSGRGLRILTGQITSPTLLRQLDGLLETFPEARWSVFEPLGAGGAREAARLAFDRPVDLVHDVGAADAIVSLGADFLGGGPAQVLHGAGWARARRRLREAGRTPDLVVFEPDHSLTGAAASRRIATAPSRLPAIAAAIAAELGAAPPGPVPGPSAGEALAALEAASLLRQAGPRGLFLLGDDQPPAVRALAHAVADRLGSPGTTVFRVEPIVHGGREPDPLSRLAREMGEGAVDTLLVIDADPVYAAPPDVAFADLMATVPLTIHAGLDLTATAAHALWHVPLVHDLEAWSDARAVDGRASILQPLVRPIYGGRQRHALLPLIAGETGADPEEVVKETWRVRFGATFVADWRAALVRGFVEGTAARPLDVTARPVALPESPSPSPGLEAVFRPDPSIWDGRFARNAWLQELPKPLSKVTWGNVIHLSPALAREAGVATGDVVRLSSGARLVEGAAFVMPGQPRDTLTLFLGYGQRFVEPPARNAGYDATRLQPAGGPVPIGGLALHRAGRTADLAETQAHFALDGYDHVRVVTPDHPHAGDEGGEHPSLYPAWDYGNPSWGMAIDLDACIGCNACIVACQAENNIPSVGPEEVRKGREMHWLRVDRYHEGPEDAPRTFFQPVPCMHCEKAPCEMGCPVHATVHGPEGLNQMIYNRCIGTRTCSSYCPYKVRRFNWFDYAGEAPPGVEAVRNPDVTVRARGVMEKCTFCIQRIHAAKMTAQLDDLPLSEVPLQTACQQACPTTAIVFGNLADAESAVSRAKEEPRNYALLGELGTRPRTTYLAAVRTPPVDAGEDG